MNGFELDFSLTRRMPGGGDFSLEVGLDTRDGITVVSGPSGAGKSTLLLSILGDLRPDRGRITVAGRTLFDSENRIDESVRHRRVGMVFQQGALFPHMTVFQNVLFADPQPFGIPMYRDERVSLFFFFFFFYLRCP